MATFRGAGLFGTAEFPRAGVNFDLDALADSVLERLRSRAPAVARALAGEAAGGDQLALAALADWLEDQAHWPQVADAAAKVRKLAAEEGDLFVLQPANHMTQERQDDLCRQWGRRLAEVTGKPARVLCLPPGAELRHFRLGGGGGAAE